MDRKLNISEARKHLFDLVDEVTREDDAVVLIEHRDNPKRAALVSETRLRYLEETLAALRAERAGEFRLAGSMTLAVPEEELEAALARSRRGQATLAKRKLRGLRP